MSDELEHCPHCGWNRCSCLGSCLGAPAALDDVAQRLVEKVRHFPTGATRDADVGKFDYEAFLSPAALEAFAAFMHRHRQQSDGSLRDGDNWQKGIPIEQYMKSLARHVVDLWNLHRGRRSAQVQRDFPAEWEDARIRIDLACAIWFNVQGVIFETMKEQSQQS